MRMCRLSSRIHCGLPRPIGVARQREAARKLRLSSHRPLDDFDESDLDELVLDDSFEPTAEDLRDIEECPPWAPDYSDPQGYNLTFEKYLENRADLPDYIKKDLVSVQYFGPPVLLAAGFRAEELPILRQIVDEVLTPEVKVVPVIGPEVLELEVQDAVKLPEPEWEKPRPAEWSRGGVRGSLRTIVFGGIPMESQAALVEVIEESGLPPVCVTIASESSREMKLGELLTDAIRIQRDRRNPERQIWEIEDRVVDGPEELAGYYSGKLKERLKSVRDGLQTGAADLEEMEDGTLRVQMDGLKDEIFDGEEISRETGSTKAVRQAEEDISALFEVDDLVYDGLGLDKSANSKDTAVGAQSDERSPDAGTDEESPDAGTGGRTFEMSTEPREVQPGVTHSTVFSGLVDDADKFMKDNFGYDVRKGGLSPRRDELKTTVVTTRAEQEAFSNSDSIEDAIQEALQKGVDADQIKSLIKKLKPRRRPH